MQAPEVSDEQAITQAIKALRVGKLHSHLVRERPKTLKALYKEFQKFSRSEVSHYRKLDQQRKVTSENKSSRSFKYSKGREGATCFDVAHKQVHNIDSDGCGPQENWDKYFRPPWQENESRPYEPRRDHQQSRGAYSSRGRGRGQYQDKPLYYMFHEKDTDHQTRDCPIFLESKKKMEQKPTQPSASNTMKEVNHTSHWNQPSQSSSSNQPSYQNYNHHLEYQPNYHRYPSQHYQPYTYTPHANQTHTPQPAITYPLPPLQITYPTVSSQTSQPKTEPNNPHPPPPTSQEPSQQATSFPIFGTIHTITRGSNSTFENKRQKREQYQVVTHSNNIHRS
jgi:hypothetical protein